MTDWAARPIEARARAEPFFWQAGRSGCLLVHGFTGTPYEMRYLGERLHAADYTVSGIRLAGHGTSARDLEATGWRDWYRAVEQGLDRLHEHCGRVAVVGQSLGALLILRLARQRPEDVAALVLLSTALALRRHWAARLTWLAKLTGPLLPETLRFVAKRGSDIADPEARRGHPGNRAIPLRAVAELVALQKEICSALPQIRQPTLAIHARQDHTVPFDENVKMLREGLGNLWRSVALSDSYHVISVDREKGKVVDEILRFLAEVGLPASGLGPPG